VMDHCFGDLDDEKQRLEKAHRIRRIVMAHLREQTRVRQRRARARCAKARKAGAR
jgi:hypothetical protein